MKHFYTLLAALVLCSVAARAAVDFSTLDDGLWNPTAAYTIKGWSGATDNDWTTRYYSGGNNFGTNTAQKPDGYGGSFRNEPGSSWYGDDTNAWLRSPGLQMKAGVTYIVKYQYKFMSSPRAMTFKSWVSTTDPVKGGSSAANTLKGTTPLSATTSLPTVWTQVEEAFVPTADGTYFLSFQNSAVADDDPSGYVYVGAINVQEVDNIAKPLAPTDLRAVAGADALMIVDLSWTLPTVDTNGDALTGDNAVTGVKVWRDGELIATLEGAVTAWQDSELTGLTPGVHSYKVAALTATAESKPSDEVSSGYVGPFVYAPSGIDFSEWSTYTPVSPGFTDNSNKPTGYTNSASIWSYSGTDNVDTWLISPVFDFKADKSYRVKFQYQYWSKPFYVEHFDVYLSPVKPDASTAAQIIAGTPVYSLSDLSNDTSGSGWVPNEIEGLKGDGPTYVLFHVSGRFSQRFGISAFELEEYSDAVKFEPAAPYDLTAVDTGTQNVELTWKLLNESTEGLPFEDGVEITAVKVTRDGEEIATLDGAATTYTDVNVKPGEYTYAVQAFAGNTWSALSEAATVTVAKADLPESMPWTPTVTNLTPDEFAENWTTFYGPGQGYSTGKWTFRPAGLWINKNGATDAWIISNPLYMNGATEFTLTYNIISATGNSHFSIGLVDTTEPTEFICDIVEDGIAPTSETPQTVNFKFPVVETQQLRAPAYGIGDIYPRLAIRTTSDGSEGTMTVRSLSMTMVESALTGIEAVEAIEATPVEVFDLQGRSLGVTTDMTLDNFAPGIYIVKTGGKTLKLRK